MNRALRVIAVVAVLGMVAAACGDNGAKTPPTPTDTANLEGGTLHMAMLADVTAAFDPQKEYPPTLAFGFAVRSRARTKSCAVISTSAFGGAYIRPGLIVYVQVKPSEDCSGSPAARSG